MKKEVIDFKVGDIVIVPFIRSGHVDSENGIGWYAQEVQVTISRINDLTFCFDFNSETHYCLKSEAKKSQRRNYNLFNEIDKVKYLKDDFDYQLKIKYGITA